MYFTVVVVLLEVGLAFKGFNGHIFSCEQVEGVVHTGRHALAYLLCGFEQAVKTQLHDKFAAQGFC
jgi:hypothetical protein